MFKRLSQIYLKIKDWGSPELKLVINFFIISILVGIFVQLLNPEFGEGFIKSFFANISKNINQDSFLGIFWFIFTNNLRVSLILIFLGVIYRFLPLIVISFNGFAIGVIVLGVTLTLKAADPFKILLLLPHGIFELPAVFIATALGMRLSRVVSKNNFKQRFIQVLKSKKELGLIVGLLFIAALIEAGGIFLS